MTSIPVVSSIAEATAMVRAGLQFLASADATQLAAEEQARCLHALEQASSISTAARTAILGAFTAAQGYTADADYSSRAWLINRTHVTKGAAVAYTAWVRRAAAHPQVAAALAAGEISESFARTLCTWTEKLPGDSRDTADEILLAAAGQGLDLRGLAELAAEMLARSRQDDAPDENTDQDEIFDDRALRLETTFDGAGVLTGELSPECAEVVNTVLDALSAPAGEEDTRTHGQRYHDALQEAMNRLVAANLLPERAGQPVRAWVHIPLADLLLMDGSSKLQEEWIADARTQWAAHRAGASAGGSGSGGGIGAWVDSASAQAVACDAAVTPIVTGAVNPAALDDLVRLCVELDRLHRSASADDGGSTPARDTSSAWAALELAVIGKAVELVSGPGGLASFLRRRQLGARLGGPSLPLDIGYSDTIPASIRNAVVLRDRHCQWAGRCSQPASACQVHHVKHKKDGGQTSVKDCVLLCWFHHQVAIHRWGWTLILNPDGTTTAWNKDRTKVLHSHGPPARAG